MEKRLILAIALSILIVVTFQHFLVKPAIPPSEKRPLAEIPQQIKAEEHEKTDEADIKLLQNESELEIETDKFILGFSNVGGALKKIRLKEYKNLQNSEPLELVNINSPREYIFNISDPLSIRSLDVSTYVLDKQKNSICYATTQGALEVRKEYIIHKSNNSIELRTFFKNISPSPIQISYKLIGGSGIIEQEQQDKRLVEVISKIDGRTFSFKHPKGKRITTLGLVSWTALKNKYFSLILKPLAQTKLQFYNEVPNGSYLTGVESLLFNIEPNQIIENKYLLYIGPSKISDLREFGFNLEETVNYGMFGWIAKGMLALMGFCYNVVHSWGVSIIILALFLNVITFPLTLQSFNSMRKMQELHPQMEKIKAQNKDNPQKMNKEIMELYKKYKINPLSGCLPMLLQMPIFIALYQALLKSVDLRGAGFLWIRDLSAPEAIKIPITLPLIGNSLNLLPIVMIIGMFLQQKISAKATGGAVTEDQKQQQKMMLIMMPVLFGFIFYNMPSGLVLYWVVNTYLTIIEQSIILRQE